MPFISKMGGREMEETAAAAGEETSNFYTDQHNKPLREDLQQEEVVDHLPVWRNIWMISSVPQT